MFRLEPSDIASPCDCWYLPSPGPRPGIPPTRPSLHRNQYVWTYEALAIHNKITKTLPALKPTVLLW